MALRGKRILTFTYVWKSNIFKLIASIWKVTNLLIDQELFYKNVLLVTSIREVSKSIFPLADARNQSKIKGALLHNLWSYVQYFPNISTHQQHALKRKNSCWFLLREHYVKNRCSRKLLITLLTSPISPRFKPSSILVGLERLENKSQCT